MTIKQLLKALSESDQTLAGYALAERIEEIRYELGQLEDLEEAVR